MAYRESSFDSVLNASRYLEAAGFALGTTCLYTLNEHPRVEELAAVAKKVMGLHEDLVKLMEEMKDGV